MHKFFLETFQLFNITNQPTSENDTWVYFK